MSDTDEITQEVPQELTWDEYQELALETAIFPDEMGFEYTVMSFHGECGEVSNDLQKVIRDNNEDKKDEAAYEAGDALWYGVTHLAYNDQGGDIGLQGPIRDEMSPSRYRQIIDNCSLPPEPDWIDAEFELAYASGKPAVHAMLARGRGGDNLRVSQMGHVASCVRHGIYTLCLVITMLGHSPKEVARHNLLKLRDRAERGELSGSGDDR